MAVRPTTDAIWASLSADLRRFIRRRVGDDHSADDLLQETFVRVHRGLPALAESDRVAAWVYRIARNVIHDHHRQRGRAALPLADDPVDEVDERSGSLPGCAEEWLERMGRLLPDGYREAVQLSEIGGLSQQEVADRLGLSLSGAKSRIQRGRVMLKGILEECCHFEFDRRGNLLGYDRKPGGATRCGCGEEDCG